MPSTAKVDRTADTVTNEEIRELRRRLRGLIQNGSLKYDDLAMAEARADEGTCTIALTDRRAMAYMMDGAAEGVHKARGRCAEILNARAAKVQP